MCWNIIINSLLIIIILHLILNNLNNIQYNVYEGLDNKEKQNVENIEAEIEGSVENVLKTNNNLKYTNININTNNILEKKNKLEILNKNIIEPSMSLNQNNNSLYGNQCTYGGIDTNDNLRSSVNFDLSNNNPINQCYQNNLDTYYKEQNLPDVDNMNINEQNNNINIQTNLLQQNNSCGYNTSQDLHMMTQNGFQEYIKNKRLNNINPNNENNNQVNTPCPSNNNSNSSHCLNNTLNSIEKPINGEIIGNYLGFNSCDNDYASYKSL